LLKIYDPRNRVLSSKEFGDGAEWVCQKDYFYASTRSRHSAPKPDTDFLREWCHRFGSDWLQVCVFFPGKKERRRTVQAAGLPNLTDRGFLRFCTTAGSEASDRLIDTYGSGHCSWCYWHFGFLGHSSLETVLSVDFHELQPWPDVKPGLGLFKNVVLHNLDSGFLEVASVEESSFDAYIEFLSGKQCSQLLTKDEQA